MAVWLMVASTVLSAVGAHQQGQQQKAQYAAYAQANEYNAAVNRQKAETSYQVANQREEQQRRNAAMFIGKQRAFAAQSGLGLGGSNADLERQSEVLAELDALNIRYEGAMQARGLLQEADMQDYNAGMNRVGSYNAGVSGNMAAASALMSGGAKAYGMSQKS
jgi:hypothetical protein